MTRGFSPQVNRWFTRSLTYHRDPRIYLLKGTLPNDEKGAIILTGVVHSRGDEITPSPMVTGYRTRLLTSGSISDRDVVVPSRIHVSIPHQADVVSGTVKRG